MEYNKELIYRITSSALVVPPLICSYIVGSNMRDIIDKGNIRLSDVAVNIGLLTLSAISIYYGNKCDKKIQNQELNNLETEIETSINEYN